MATLLASSMNLLIGKRAKLKQGRNPTHFNEGVVVDTYGAAGTYHYNYYLVVLGENGYLETWNSDICHVVPDPSTGPYR